MFKSKTMWFAMALVVFGTLEANLPNFLPNIPDEYQGWTVTAIGLAVAILRFVTTQPLSEK